MIPTQGRTVIVAGIHSNGLDHHPAVITRAWGQGDTKQGAIAVNLTIFPDTAPPTHRTSVMLFETEKQAREQQNGSHNLVAWWPAPAALPAR